MATMQTAQWQIAHEWHGSLDLRQAGVDLGEAMTYEVLRVVGRILKRHIMDDKHG